MRASPVNRFRLYLLGLLTALAALLTAFVLPFLFAAHQQPVYSATYPVGAENRVATVGLALLSLLVLLWSWVPHPLQPHRKGWGTDHPHSPLTLRTTLIGAILIALWTLALGAAVAHSHMRFGESAYFLERMRDTLFSSGRIYTDIEFPYGPLLLLPPVWLARLGVPLTAGYFASLTLLNVAGIFLTAYVLNRLPLTHTARILLFWLFCFEQANPLAGANYSLGKFMLPFAVLLWGIARETFWTRLLALTAGQLLVILVSPELGVGLGAGICGWAILTAVQTHKPANLLAALAPPAAYAIFFAAYGRGFLERLGHASGGALNLIIEPLPHTFVLIAGLVFLAPLAVGRRLRIPVEGPILCAVYLLALGLLPGALGRSDPLHVFFNGFGFLLLAFIGLRGRSVILWAAAVALLCLQVQVTNFAIYRPMLEDMLHPTHTPALDTARLRADTHGAPVATPALFTMPLSDELALRSAGLYLPDKLPGLAEVWTPTDEAAKIARMRTTDWALVPAEDYTQAEGSPNSSRFKRPFRFGFRYPQRRQPYIVGRLLEQELTTKWQPADHLGDEILYHRVR